MANPERHFDSGQFSFRAASWNGKRVERETTALEACSDARRTVFPCFPVFFLFKYIDKHDCNF